MADTEPGDAEKTEAYLQGSFKIGNLLYNVALSDDNLKWLKKDDPPEKAGIAKQIQK